MTVTNVLSYVNSELHEILYTHITLSSLNINSLIYKKRYLDQESKTFEQTCLVSLISDSISYLSDVTDSGVILIQNLLSDVVSLKKDCVHILVEVIFACIIIAEVLA